MENSKLKEMIQRYKNLQEELKKLNIEKIKINTIACKIIDLIDYKNDNINEYFIFPEYEEGKRGNFIFGFKLDDNGDIIPNSSTALFHKINNFEEYICEFDTGRKLPNTHNYKCNLSFLDDKNILVRSFNFNTTTKYYETIKKDNIYDGHKGYKGHFIEQFFMITELENNHIDISLLPYQIGKEMWKNTTEYKNKVAQEKNNREKNLLGKTIPSALSKEEKQFILSKQNK